MEHGQEVPSALKKWFVAHFVVDMLFAIPLFLAPAWFLGLFGWTVVDPATARVAAAALFGIGIQSFIGRNESLGTFRAMLNLKIVWSAFATVGIAYSVIQGAPSMGWMFAAVFAVFFVLWTTWRRKLA